jgi:hypothetical protein
MAHIELPRALEDYFAFAETAPTRNGRRFVISLPYFRGALTGGGTQLDRLQWWYHVGPEQERQMGEAAIATLRAQATDRFCRHIERWLQNTRQRLHGDDPIPRIDPLDSVASPPAATPVTSTAATPEPTAVAGPTTLSNIVEWPADKVANG